MTLGLIISETLPLQHNPSQEGDYNTAMCIATKGITGKTRKPIKDNTIKRENQLEGKPEKGKTSRWENQTRDIPENEEKNLAYGRQSISRPMRIVAPIPQ